MTVTPEQILKDAWEPISELPPQEWIRDNVPLPESSELKQFDFELFPLAVFVISQICSNEELRRFTEMLSAQVGKTVTVLACLLWSIKNRPRSSAWYTDTNTNAKTDYKTKILPTLEGCETIAPLLPADRAKKNNTLIQFGFMDLLVLGAETKRNREGKTVSDVYCDEARNYPPGAMEQIENRYKTITNYRKIIFSSAGLATNEPWLSFQRGTRHMGFWNCPHCQHKQTFRFGREETLLYPKPRNCGGFVWDDNEITHPSDDVYNLEELKKTIRYECENEACRYRFTESEKLPIIKAVRYEQTNLMAASQDVSVQSWEAYSPFSGCSWGSIVTRFLNASVAMRHGNIEPMKVFVCECLGEPWELKGQKILEGEIMKRCGEYSRGEEWTGVECAKQITVDNQHGFIHFNYSVFNRAGEKRTIERGTLATFDELRAYQIAKGVKDRGVGIDCAHKPADVYEACLKYGNWKQDPAGGKDHIWNGWVPLLGDDAEEFTDWTVDKQGQRHAVKTFFKKVLINANEGKGKMSHIHRFSWSNPHYKEALYLYRILGKGLLWQIYKNIEPEYVKQMQATERRTIPNAEGQTIGYIWHEKGRHDDGDCELMQLALADINGITKI